MQDGDDDGEQGDGDELAADAEEDGTVHHEQHAQPVES